MMYFLDPCFMDGRYPGTYYFAIKSGSGGHVHEEIWINDIVVRNHNDYVNRIPFELFYLLVGVENDSVMWANRAAA